MCCVQSLAVANLAVTSLTSVACSCYLRSFYPFFLSRSLSFFCKVWVEIFVPSLGRYVHADPCEKSLDAPLTYEAGWNKKLSYVFAFSRFGVTDVIHRYSRKFSSTVCQSRSLCTEKFVQTRVKAMDSQVQQWYCQQLLFRQGSNVTLGLGTEGRSAAAPLTLARFQQGHTAFAPSYYSNLNLVSELSFTDLVERKRAAQKDLQMLMFLQSTQFSPEELQGRISGDTAWKESRGEAGLPAATATATATATAVEEGSCREVEGMEWLKKVWSGVVWCGLVWSGVVWSVIASSAPVKKRRVLFCFVCSD
mgnify:FL=1